MKCQPKEILELIKRKSRSPNYKELTKEKKIMTLGHSLGKVCPLTQPTSHKYTIPLPKVDRLVCEKSSEPPPNFLFKF